MVTEQEIQRDILHYLKTHGFFAWKQHTQGIRVQGRGYIKNPSAGCPDILAVKKGQLYAIEVKKKGGRLSDDQVRWIATARKYGVMCIVAYSLDEFIVLLNTPEFF